jgi:hypothetical protein
MKMILIMIALLKKKSKIVCNPSEGVYTTAIDNLNANLRGKNQMISRRSVINIKGTLKKLMNWD